MNIIEYAKLKKMFGKGGGASGASAYTVSNIDELNQINAVDGSMAIVKSDTISGEWEWHETVDITLDGVFMIPVKYDMYYGDEGYFATYNDGLIFLDGEVMGVLNCYPDHYNDYYELGDWLVLTRKITFLKDTDNVEFKNFVKNNAERLSGGYSLYVRENGEWVYKCEVV